MDWDQQLLKRFSSIGHFRLLNQVKGELKNNPLVRDHPTKVSKSTNQNAHGNYPAESERKSSIQNFGANNNGKNEINRLQNGFY